MLGPASALLMGCVGRAPPTPAELEAPLLAFFMSVQELLGHGLACCCIALWVGWMLYTIVWCCKGESC